MAKPFSQIRQRLKEAYEPDPKPAMVNNGHSNIVREEDEVDEAVGNNLSARAKRVGQKNGHQKRSPAVYAVEAIARVKKNMKQNGNTDTGGQAPTVTSEPIVPSLTGYH